MPSNKKHKKLVTLVTNDVDPPFIGLLASPAARNPLVTTTHLLVTLVTLGVNNK